MKAPIRIGLWWVPFLLVAAPLFGWIPGHRDLLDFFLPMRQATASMLATGTAPWLNLANGCGEAWFANPETAVLYPPAWLHMVFPSQWALSLEIALHLLPLGEVLADGKKQLQILEDKNNKIQVFGLEEKEAHSASDVQQIIDYGSSIRTTHATSANDTSSRSHAICQLSVRIEGK